MSLSQPSRTIVVEPVQAAVTVPEPPPDETSRRVEAPAAPAPPAETTAAA
jgi:hypothetical protein